MLVEQAGIVLLLKPFLFFPSGNDFGIAPGTSPATFTKPAVSGFMLVMLWTKGAVETDEAMLVGRAGVVLVHKLFAIH
jgi:hypothetical protein